MIKFSLDYAPQQPAVAPPASTDLGPTSSLPNAPARLQFTIFHDKKTPLPPPEN